MRSYRAIATGFYLIKIIIASAIIGTGLLLFGMLQQKALVSFKNSSNRSMAAMIARECAHRMLVNMLESSKTLGSYAFSYASIDEAAQAFVSRKYTNETDQSAHADYLNNLLESARKECYNIYGCNSAKRAVLDLYEIKAIAKSLLPEGRVIIAIPTNRQDQHILMYKIKVLWHDLEFGIIKESNHILEIPIYCK